ncbi:hypothetical protein S40293_07672 [Stachybotrys chartarum IBT 40293]|nr:hypothetical protein S40293_07672 [Stachybotrys chartarum IBT 40293]
MPTPSSDQPTGTSSPPPYALPTSTCPDDLQQSDRSVHSVTAVDRDLHHEPSADSPASSTFLHPHTQYGRSPGDAVMLGAATPAEPSSRATTMSPGPQSGGTNITSPIQGGVEAETEPFKMTHNLDSDCHWGGENSSATGDLPRHMEALSNRSGDTLDNTTLEDSHCVPHMGPDYPVMRAMPISPSSHLRPGSRFHGTQQSERQVYEVQVEIKQVDMRESFLCGYLRIQGLTEDHPTLTTYFEGEIIGTKYSFFTQHEDWGANAKVDLSHWAKFSAFRPFQKHARKGPVVIQDVAQKEHIFMRWKEHFLVPDHRVRTISGASFEGFYYICFNQVRGEVSGIYFHSKSEKFQQLELKHVPDRGCFSATEFR